MATSGQLQQQLAKIRERPESQQDQGWTTGAVSKKKRQWIASLAYDPSEAVHYDIEMLRRRASESFDTLILERDPHLCHLAELFNCFPTKNNFSHKKRRFLTRQENDRLNHLLHEFFVHLGSYWQDPNALHCLEYLLRQYEIHKYNVDDILTMALPYHDTPLFVRLVQNLHLVPSHLFIFLKKVAKSGVPLKRSVFVENCVRNPALLSFLSHAVIESVRLGAPMLNVSLITFFTVCCLETFSTQTLQPSEAFIRQFLPCLFFALENPIYQELHSSGLLIFSALCKRVTLSRALCEACAEMASLGVVNKIFTPSLRHAALVGSLSFLNIMILEQGSKEQDSLTGFFCLPQRVVERFVQEDCCDDVLQCLRTVCSDQKFDMTPFIGILFRSFFHGLKNTVKDHTHRLCQAVEKFCLKLLNLECFFHFKTRLCICLSLFEAFLSCPPDVCEQVPKIILGELEKRSPTTTVAFRYFVNLTSASRASQKLLKILCGMLMDESLVPVVFNSPTAYQDLPLDLWSALADKNVHIRQHSVALALDYFKKEIISEKNSPMIHVLCKLLQQCASDASLCIARQVFSCAQLWSASPLSESLANLFHQIHCLIYRVTQRVSLAYNVSASEIPYDSGLTILLPYLVMGENETKERLIMNLKCLSCLLQSPQHKRLARDVLDQLFPLVMPLCWGVSVTTQFDTLRDHLVECLVACQAQDIQLLSDHHTHSLLNSEMLALMLIYTSFEIEQQVFSLDTFKSKVQPYEHKLAQPAPIDYTMPMISVCRLSESIMECPKIFSPTGRFRAGPWTPFSFLEAFCYLASHEYLSSRLNAGHMTLVVRLCWDLWIHVMPHHHTQTTQKRFSCLLKRCLFSSFPLLESQSLFHTAVLLSLLDLFSIDEAIHASTLSSWFLPSVFLLLVHNPEGYIASGLSLPLSFQTIFRTNAIQLLRHMVDHAHHQALLDIPLPLFMAVIFQQFSEVHETARQETFSLTKSLSSFIKKKTKTALRTFTSFPLDVVNLLDAVNGSPNDASEEKSALALVSYCEKVLASRDPPLSLLNQQLVHNATGIVKLLFQCLLLCSLPSLRNVVYPILATAPVDDVLLFLLPLTRLCFTRSEPCHDLVELVASLWRHVGSCCMAQPQAMALWNDLLLPLTSHNTSHWTPPLHEFFYEILHSVVDKSPNQPSLAPQLVPLLCLSYQRNTRAQNAKEQDILTRMFSKTLTMDTMCCLLDKHLWPLDDPTHLGMITLIIETMTERWGLRSATLDKRVPGFLDSLVLSLLEISASWLKPCLVTEQMVSCSSLGLLSQSVRCMGELVQSNGGVSQKIAPPLRKYLLSLLTFTHQMFSHHFQQSDPLTHDLMYELGLDVVCLGTQVLKKNPHGSRFGPWEEHHQLVDSICCHVLVPLLTCSPGFVVAPTFQWCFEHFILVVYDLSQDAQTPSLVLLPFYHISYLLLTSFLSSFDKPHLEHTIEEDMDSFCHDLVRFCSTLANASVFPFSHQSHYLSCLLSFLLASWFRVSTRLQPRGSPLMDSTVGIHRLCLAFFSTLGPQLYMSILLDCLKSLGQDSYTLFCPESNQTVTLPTTHDKKSFLQTTQSVLSFVVQQIHTVAFSSTIPSKLITMKNIDKLQELFTSTQDLSTILSNTLEASTGVTTHEPKKKDSHVFQLQAYTLYWLASCIVSLVSVATAQQKVFPKAALEAIACTTSQLVGLLHCPITALFIVFLVSNHLFHEWSQHFYLTRDSSWKKKHWGLVFSHFSQLIAQQCFLKKIMETFTTAQHSSLDLEMRNQGFSLLSTRQSLLAQKAAPIIEAVLKSLLDSVRFTHKTAYRISQLIACHTLTFSTSATSSFIPHLPAFLHSALKSPNLLFSLNEKWRRHPHSQASHIINLLNYATLHGLPLGSFLPEFNHILVSFLEAWDQTLDALEGVAQSNDSIMPLTHLKELLSFLGIVATSPALPYASCHLDALVNKALLRTQVLQLVVIQQLQSEGPLTLLQLYTHMALVPHDTVWLNFIQQLLNPQPLATKETCLTAFHVWSHVTYLFMSFSSLNNVVKSLVSCIVEEAPKISALATDWPDTWRAALALQSLGCAVAHHSPESSLVLFEPISKALMSFIHAAVKSVECIAQDSEASSLVLEKSIQSGFEVHFFTQHTHCPFTTTLGHPLARFDDSSSPSNLSGRVYALMETSLVLFMSSWLPKLTNAQLSPLIQSLIKYTAHGLPSFMDFSSTPDSQNPSLSSPINKCPDSLISRNACSSRLFFILYTTIASEMGEVAILSSLWNVVPHLKSALMAAQRQLFHLALLCETEVEHKKKRKKISSASCSSPITTSWWWFDLGMPCLLCIIKVAQVTVSVPFVDIFLPLVLDALDVFSLLPMPQVVLSNEQFSFQSVHQKSGLLAHTWLWAVIHATQALLTHILADPLRVSSALKPLLSKAQSSKSSNVRYTSVLLLHQLWCFHGVGLLGTLEDSMEVLNDLLDDTHTEIEHVTSLLVKHIEGLTGEAMQSRLGETQT